MRFGATPCWPKFWICITDLWAARGWCSDGVGRRMKICYWLNGVGSLIRGCCCSLKLLKTKICWPDSMDAAAENLKNRNKVPPNLKNKLLPMIGRRIWGR
ncbi:hypothetical protein ACLOJK_028476 [Asimina triloba]